MRTVAADILLHHIDAIDGQVEAIAGFILQVQKLAFDVGNFEKPETTIDANSMIQMNDIIVLLELAETGKEMARIIFRRGRRLTLSRPEDLVKSDENEMRFRQSEALGEMAADNSPSKFRPPEGCRRWLFGQGELNIVIAQKLPEPRCVALGRGNEDDLFRFPGLKLLDQRLERGLFAVQSGFLASVGGQISFGGERHFPRSLRSGHDHEGLTVDLGKRV